MKKIYLKPEMTRFELFAEEAILQAASVTIDVRNELIHYIEQTDALGYKIN